MPLSPNNPYAKYISPDNPYAKYVKPDQPAPEEPRDPEAPDPVGFVAGLAQGMADIPEGAGQIIQKGGEAVGVDPSRLVPGFVQRGAEALRQRAQASTAGQVGETIGGVGSFLLAPEFALPRVAETLGPVAQTVARVLGRSTLPSVLQPTDPNDPNFWTTKAEQAGAGTVLGEGMQAAGRLGKRILSSQEAQRALEFLQNQYKRYNEAIGQINEARARGYQTPRDIQQGRGPRTERERVADYNEAVKQLNEARTGRYQESVGARDLDRFQRQQREQQLKQTQAEIPRAVTQQWWRETLRTVGAEGEAPSTVGPEASAHVRRVIGDRLTAIQSQMSFSADPASFGTVLRDRTAQTLNAANRGDWEQMFNESVIQPVVKNRGNMNGRQLADYSSDLRNRIEELSRRIRSEDMPESRRSDLTKMRNSLRAASDAIDNQAIGSPEAKAELQKARRGYMLWSIGNGGTAAEKGGMMTPESIAREWAGRQGDAAYGAEMNPGDPRYHPENARLKRFLETHRQAGQFRLPPAQPQMPLRPPGKWETARQPPKPAQWAGAGEPPVLPSAPPSDLASAARRAARGLLAAKTGGLYGLAVEPAVTAFIKSQPEAVGRGLAAVGRGGPAASATVGRALGGQWNVTDDGGNWIGITTDPSKLGPGQRLGSQAQ